MDNLTANQERARFVAKDIKEYTRSVPAGRVIKSSELRKVLIAKDGETGGHNETVSRVMSKLNEFGKSDVSIRKSRAGERVVVFSEAIVERIESFPTDNHSVVTGTKA